MMWERWAQDKSLFRPNDRKGDQATTPTETPFRQSICHRYQKDSRSGTGTGEGGRKNRRSTLTYEKGTNGSHPEKGLGGRDLGQRKGFRHQNAGFSLESPGPEQSNLYITSGLQMMAITRKRKQPSAGSDLDQEESHPEDSRPSKKTATSKYNLQSAEGLPFPKSGPVPVIVMILYFGEQEETVRALLDTGSTVPLLSLSLVEQKQIPVAETESKRTIQDYAG